MSELDPRFQAVPITLRADETVAEIMDRWIREHNESVDRMMVEGLARDLYVESNRESITS